MPKVMKTLTCFSFTLTIITSLLFNCLHQDIYLTLAITSGTTFYHLGIRLLIGFLYSTWMKNQADYTKKWYQIHPWDEIAQTMCQSELVHETNIVFSFIPVIASRWFGSFYVFLTTSLCGAIFDLLFVIMQRYNRPRVIKIALNKFCQFDKNCKAGSLPHP